MANLRRAVVGVLDTFGTFLLSPPRSGFGHYHNHGPRHERKIALTFDDGPSKHSTERLLEAMGRLDVRGTFFCIGTQVQWQPDLIRQMFQAGHVIGNHSMAHRRVSGLKPGPDDGHIDDSARAISEVIGRMPRLYRPPWGWLTPWEAGRLADRGYTVIGWDIYTDDWKVPEIDGREIAAFAIQAARPGSIILMHDSRSLMPECPKIEHVRAVELIVDRLRAQGYTFVTIPELLGVPAYAPAR